MKTIIQKLPTINGEPLNGSVYGQPNGSIARPPQSVAGTLTINGTVTVEKVSQGAQITTYNIAGMSFVVNIPSGWASVKAVVYKSNNTPMADGFFNPYMAPVPVSGPNIDQPSDGDTLSVVVQFLDSDGNVIVKSSISATAVMV